MSLPSLESRVCHVLLTNIPARGTPHLTPGEQHSRKLRHSLIPAYNIYLIRSCSQRAIKSKSTQLLGKEKGSCSSPPPEPK